MHKNKGFVELILLFMVVLLVVIILASLENAKKLHKIQGTPVKVMSGENPDYAKWKEKREGDWVGPFEVTSVTFKDGRTKIFHGVSDFEIPLDKPVIITYNGWKQIINVKEKTNE